MEVSRSCNREGQGGRIYCTCQLMRCHQNSSKGAYRNFYGILHKVEKILKAVMPSGWARWALAHAEFGSSVNPITTRGADYDHPITASPPGFKNLAASLKR